MNKEELLDKLKELEGDGDEEKAHVLADRALLEYINDPDIQEAYQNVPKFYG